jgi:hypothetical protein
MDFLYVPHAPQNRAAQHVRHSVYMISVGFVARCAIMEFSPIARSETSFFP